MISRKQLISFRSVLLRAFAPTSFTGTWINQPSLTSNRTYRQLVSILTNGRIQLLFIEQIMRICAHAYW